MLTVSLPLAFLLTGIGVDNSSFAVPPVFLKLSVIEGTVGPPELSLAVSLVVEHIASVLPLVPPLQSTLAVHRVVLLLSFVGRA